MIYEENIKKIFGVILEQRELYHWAGFFKEASYKER